MSAADAPASGRWLALPHFCHSGSRCELKDGEHHRYSPLFPPAH